MHIGLYGGSFNPPHVAHQMAVAYVLATKPVDELWVMPTPGHAFGKPLTPFPHRLEMTRLAMRHFGPRVVVSALENELPMPSRTLDTVRALKEQRPGATITVIIGADIVPETRAWKGWEELQQTCGVVVLGREGYPAAGSVLLPAVSSTVVRRLLARGELEAAGAMLDLAVLEYAVRQGLYVAG